MRDQERLALFAEFLELRVPKLRELVVARGLVSRSTLDRIRGGHRQDTTHAKARSFAMLAKFIDPEYLAAPSVATDPFIHTEVARRLRTVGWSALVLWDAFLRGETDDIPTWSSIQAHWLASCAQVPPSPAEDASHPHGARERLARLVDALERLGSGEGLIEGARTPADLVRWRWIASRPADPTWLQMRAAYYRAQALIEHAADAIYLGTPVLSFALLPSKLWQCRIGAAGAFDDELLDACAARWARLQNALAHRRQTVVALFSEQRTKEFFETLQPEERAACAQHVEGLARGGLTLLATTLSVQEERELCVSITLGGGRPGLATADQLTTLQTPERSAIVTSADAPEYNHRRTLFEDVWNSRRTRRIHPAELRDLVPKERVARRPR